MTILKIADILINISSFGMVIGMFALWAGNYKALPDKIPIHFCITGKADWWVRKTLVSAYFMPFFTAIIWPVVFVSFHLNAGAGNEEMPPEFTLIGSGMAFALTLLFFNLSRGMINIALGKAANIFGYLIPSFLLVMAFAGGISYFAASIGKRPPVFDGVTLCPAVDKRNVPLQAAGSFPDATKEVYAVAKWKYLNGEHRITSAWIAPDGSAPHGGLYTLAPQKHIKFTRRIPFTLDLSAMKKMGIDIRGNWTVKISLDGKEQSATSFTITRPAR